MNEVDVQLMAMGAIISVGDVGLRIDSPTFDTLADKVAEAALAKQGREVIMGTADDLKRGDHLFGMEVTGVNRSEGSRWTEVYLGMDSEFITVYKDRVLRIERPIS